MSNIDIEIYLSKFKGFFDKNPEQLTILIGKIEPQLFYDGIKEIVTENSKTERPLEPSRNQIMDLLVKINTGKTPEEVRKITNLFLSHHMGKICLN